HQPDCIPTPPHPSLSFWFCPCQGRTSLLKEFYPFRCPGSRLCPARLSRTLPTPTTPDAYGYTSRRRLRFPRHGVGRLKGRSLARANSGTIAGHAIDDGREGTRRRNRSLDVRDQVASPATLDV